MYFNTIQVVFFPIHHVIWKYCVLYLIVDTSEIHVSQHNTWKYKYMYCILCTVALTGRLGRMIDLDDMKQNRGKNVTASTQIDAPLSVLSPLGGYYTHSSMTGKFFLDLWKVIPHLTPPLTTTASRASSTPTRLSIMNVALTPSVGHSRVNR